MKIKQLTISLVLSLMLISCGTEVCEPLAPAMEQHRVEVRLNTGETDSRAFFDESASAEPWEKKINSLSILVFDLAGNLKLQHDVSGAALESGYVEFILPQTFGGNTYDFYAVANRQMPYFQCKTVEQLFAEIDSSIADHNGAFDKMICGGLSPEGFAMSGHSRSAIDTDGVTVLHISMVRTVAKIALRTTLDHVFTEKYPGELTITSVTVMGCATETPLVSDTDRTVPTCSFTQLSRMEKYGQYDNLFYLFASPPEGITLIFDGVYDEDTPVHYSVTLQVRVSRNTFYRIGIIIKGLSKADAGLMLDVADWGYPIDVEDRFDY